MSQRNTTQLGTPVPDNDRSQSAGERGPLLLQDYFLLEKLAHFNRERIPERVVHAKGAGAFGYFEASRDMSAYTSAHLFGAVGRRCKVATRFSTVGGERGSSDAERDPRGFAVKFYTESGNYDIVGNNTPVFFIRDPMKFPDMVHTHKRNPVSNLKDHDAFWDFFSWTPESTHQVTILFSDRGIPADYRHMHGFGSHTFKWINAAGEACWVKYHFRSAAGIKNLTAQQAAVNDPDHATRDLFQHIALGGEACWNVCVQIMPYEDAWLYRYDPFDVTRVWRYQDYPLIMIGRLTLNHNPKNYFAEVEQLAFSPANFVPGIEASPDKLLQGRLFAYTDTQRYRLGANFNQIPVNCPYAASVFNQQRDGLMTVTDNGGGAPNYVPNRQLAPGVGPTEHHASLSGETGRFSYPKGPHLANDFEQAGLLYRLLSAEAQACLVSNIVDHMQGIEQGIKIRMAAHFTCADLNYGRRVALGLGIDMTAVEARVLVMDTANSVAV